MNSFYKSKQRFATYDKRLIAFAVISILIASIIIIRLFILQVINGKIYKAMAFGSHSIYSNLEPERGKIFIKEINFSERYPVATNEVTYRIYIEPDKIQNKSNVARELADILNLEEDDLIKKINKNDPYEPIAQYVSGYIVEQIKEFGFKGVGFEEQVKRIYPEQGFGGQILGFVGFDTLGERSGKYGIEGYFDKELKGSSGYLQGEKDALGRLIPLADQKIEEAVDGYDLELTIDRGVQFYICNKLEEGAIRYGAKSGSIIVMDPNKGSILGLCSYPDYNPNKYNEVEDRSIFNNPAIFEQYEPGSVIKPITMAVGIDVKVVSPDSTYEDEGSVYIKPYTIKNSDGKSNGKQTMTQVLEKSLNTGVIYVVNLLGAKTFMEYIERFGFGSLTGIELDGEATGDISSLSKKGDIWSATASFGQGISVTSLQMLNAFNIIANGGKLMRPYILAKKIDNNGVIYETYPEPVAQVISSKTSTLLKGMLVSVVENGHASQASVQGYYIGGKTGTAQISKKGGGGYEEDQKIVSFIGFAPADSPKFSVLVKLDNPENVDWAANSAAPIFGEVAKFLLNYYKIAPER